MNTLSWLLYFAEVADRLDNCVSAISVIAIILWFLWTFCKSLYIERWTFAPFRVLIIGIVAMIFAIFIPSGTTMYMIASSEIGERVVTSQDGKELLALLKKKIVKILDTEK